MRCTRGTSLLLQTVIFVCWTNFNVRKRHSHFPFPALGPQQIQADGDKHGKGEAKHERQGAGDRTLARNRTASARATGDARSSFGAIDTPELFFGVRPSRALGYPLHGM